MTECSMCGVPIPNGQDSMCSVCYCDPAWGHDGLLQARLDEQARVSAQQAMEHEAALAEASAEREYDPGL